MQRSFLQVLVAIGLVLAGSYYWRPGGNPAADPEIIALQKALPKTYLTNTRSWLYNDSGELTEVLEASKVEQFSPRDVSVLASPRYYSHNGNDRTWSASADQGRFHQRNQILYLRENVLLTNDQTGGQLEARAMTVDTRNKTAKSKVPVKIRQGTSTIQADGMLADLNQERIQMMPNVESTYVTPRP